MKRKCTPTYTSVGSVGAWNKPAPLCDAQVLLHWSCMQSRPGRQLQRACHATATPMVWRIRRSLGKSPELHQSPESHQRCNHSAPAETPVAVKQHHGGGWCPGAHEAATNTFFEPLSTRPGCRQQPVLAENSLSQFCRWRSARASRRWMRSWRTLWRQFKHEVGT